MTKKEAVEVMSTFIDGLFKVRIESGFTRIDFSKLIGVNDTTYSSWERMYTVPAPSSVETIWSLLGEDVERVAGVTREKVLEASGMMWKFRKRQSKKPWKITPDERKRACESLGVEMQRIREANGLSRPAVTAKLKLGKCTYSSWERGFYAPAYSHMRAVCDLLGVADTDPIWSLWRRASVNPFRELEGCDLPQPSDCSVDVNSVSEIPVVKAALTDVHVSLARVLNRMNEDGIVADTPVIIQSHVSRYSAYVVAEAFNKKNGLDYLELPWALPKSTLTPHPTYVWVKDGVLQHATDLFEFDWSGYLKRNNLSVRVVMSAEEEDSEFFKEDFDE